MRWGGWVVLAAALAACSPRGPEVEGAWVRLAAVPGRPAAAYFTVQGGRAGATLTGVTSAEVGRAELHESMANGMRATATVAVPAGGTVTFAPAGRHVMLYGVALAVKPGTALPLRFAFADGRGVEVSAKVVGPADAAP